MNNNQNALKIVVLVSGRGTNLQAIIDAQNNTIKSQICAVISNKEDVQALDRAKKAKIPSFVIPTKDPNFFSKLEEKITQLSPDLIILAGFMKILPVNFVQKFRNKIINIHPSLLPAFPGLDAQKQAIEAGVKITGCTVHYVDEGCDTGPIILQNVEEIKDDDTVHTLSDRLLIKEHKTMIKTIQLLENNKVILQGSKTLLRR